MGMDELLEELGRRTRRREVEVRRRAEAEAERILDRAREETDELREQGLEEAEEELRAELSRKRTTVERRERDQVMEARAELLGRVRRRAAELLEEEAQGDVFRERLPHWLRDARSCLPADRDVVVRCGPALEDMVRDALTELGDGGPAAGVRLETDESMGAGFRAAAGSAGVAVDATLEGLLARDWEDLARDVVSRLEDRWAGTGAP